MLAVSLIFSSFGSATGQSAAQSSPVAQKKAEISVIVATGYKGYFEDVLLKSMAKKYPKVTVKVTYNSEPTPTIQQQLAADGDPDVVGTQGTRHCSVMPERITLTLAKTIQFAVSLNY